MPAIKKPPSEISEGGEKPRSHFNSAASCPYIPPERYHSVTGTPAAGYTLFCCDIAANASPAKLTNALHRPHLRPRTERTLSEK